MHIHTKYEVSILNPVARRAVHRRRCWMTPMPDNNYARRTNHDYIGSFGRIPNEPKRAVLIERMTVANEIYLAHLQNYKQEDPKKRSQKYLILFNELIDKLNQQFETVVAMLTLPFEKSLKTYPSLEYVMDIVQQEDLSDKNREFFQELMREVEIKNAFAQNVLNNRLAAVGNSEEEVEVNLQHKENQNEGFRLLRFCRKMIEKKDKEAGYIEFDQPEGVPNTEPITKKELGSET